MKNILLTNIKQLTAHRRLVLALAGLVLLSLGVIIYMAITIESSDLRVITQYTAFGLTHFYRSSWVYLLSFIAFVVITVVFSVGICLKLLNHEREPLAFTFSWIAFAIVLVTFITYMHIDELV